MSSELSLVTAKTRCVVVYERVSTEKQDISRQAVQRVVKDLIADGLVRLGVEPGGDELRQARPRLVQNPERAVVGVDEIGGGLDDPLEDGRQVEIGAHRQHRLHQLAQRPGTGVL